MVLVPTGNGQFVGFSGDRPTVGIVSGSRFTDVNTGEESFWNGSIWRQAPRSVFSGSNITGVVSGSPTFAGSVSVSGNLVGTINAETSTIALGIPTSTWSVYYSSPFNVKARNNISGTIPFSNTSGYINTVLTSIVSGISPAGTPTSIEIGEGDFYLGSGFTAIGSGKVGNIKIKGQGPGLTNVLLTSGCARGFLIAGMVAVSGKVLTADASGAMLSVTMASGDANTFTSGDYALLRSDLIWASGMTSQAARQGEIHKVREVASGVIAFHESTMDRYTTANNAILSKITMLQNITLEDLKIAPIASGYTGQTNAILQCDFIDNLKLKNVEVDDNTITGGSNVFVKNILNSDLDVIVSQTGNYPFVELPSTGQYGVYIGLASQHVKLKVIGRGRWRHVVTGGGINTTLTNAGIPRDITITGSSETSMSTAFDWHADGEGVAFQNCNISSLGSLDDDSVHNTGGINSRCKQVSVVGCNIHMTTHFGIRLSELAHSSTIAGNTIHSMRKYNNGTQGVGIYLDNGITGTTITGNSLYDANAVNFGIYGDGGNNNTTIVGNTLINFAPIRFIDALDVVVANNRISNGSNKAIIMVGTSDYWIITGNNARGSAASTFVGSSGIKDHNINL